MNVSYLEQYLSHNKYSFNVVSVIIVVKIPVVLMLRFEKGQIFKNTQILLIK